MSRPFGYHHTPETIEKLKKRRLSEEAKLHLSITRLGDKNVNWKGNEVGYYALHDWAKARLPKPSLCTNCQQRPPKDLANISQEYKRDIEDWEWLCRRCHMLKDGRLHKNLKQYKGITS